MNSFKVVKSIYFLLDKKLKIFAIFICFLLLLTSFVETFSIASIAPVISSLNSQNNSSNLLPFFDYFIVNDISLKFKLMVSSLFLFSILKTFSLHLLNNFGYKVTSRIEFIILSSDLKRINQRFSPDWKSELNASLTGRIDCTKDALIKSMGIFSASISIFLIIVVNALSHPLLIVYVSTSLIFLYFLISLILKHKLRINSKIIAKGKFNRINITKEILNYKREILISGLSSNATKRFIKNTKKLRKAEAFGDTISELPKTWVESFALAIILSSGVYFLKDDYNSITAIGILAVSGQKIITYLQYIFSGISLIRNKNEDVKIICEQAYLDKNTYSSVEENYKFEKLEVVWNQIYKNNIEPSNLVVEKGDKVLITGLSGCGKTMLFESILGLEKCKDISLSCYLSKDYINYKITSVPNNLTSYIPQESYLSDGTILDNILFFQDNHDLEKIKSIYEICGLVTICKFENLKNFKVGDGGKVLSGGQRQRVALARLIYMNKEIILLDEATSALDKESEYKIISKLIESEKNNTVVCISHNKSLTSLFNKKFIIKGKNYKN